MTASMHARTPAPPDPAFDRGRARRRHALLAAGRLALAAAVAGVIVDATACTEGSAHAGRADRALATRATGVWDAELLLEEVPLRAATGTPPGGRARVTGALSMLAGEQAERAAGEWLQHPATLTGVYDLDVGPLGFALPAGGDVTGLVAATVAPDSLVAVLPAGGADRVLVLRGTLAGDSARGTWTYAGRTLPVWRGTFRLRRRS